MMSEVSKKPQEDSQPKQVLVEQSDPTVLQRIFDSDPVAFRELLLENKRDLRTHQKELTELIETEKYVEAGGLDDGELITFMAALKTYSEKNDKEYILGVIRSEIADRKKMVDLLTKSIANQEKILDDPKNEAKLLKALGIPSE